MLNEADRPSQPLNTEATNVFHHDHQQTSTVATKQTQAHGMRLIDIQEESEDEDEVSSLNKLQASTINYKFR